MPEVTIRFSEKEGRMLCAAILYEYAGAAHELGGEAGECGPDYDLYETMGDVENFRALRIRAETFACLLDRLDGWNYPECTATELTVNVELLRHIADEGRRLSHDRIQNVGTTNQVREWLEAVEFFERLLDQIGWPEKSAPGMVQSASAPPLEAEAASS